MTNTDPTPELTETTITAWVEQYLAAWRSNADEDIAALFTDDAEYHETPYSTDWVGRDAIIAGWQSRWQWQQGGWSFDWSIASSNGRTAVIVGTGRYTELGSFDNEWTVRFAPNGRCQRFDMVNEEIDA